MFSPENRFTFKNGQVVTGKVNGGSDIRKIVARSRHEEKATSYPAGGLDQIGSVGSSVNLTATGPLALTYMMTGLVPEQEALLRRYYHDIYFYDSVAGSAVDAISTFPFSEYTLTGAKPEILEKFNESLVRLNVRSLMPEISIAYLVDGEFIGSPIFYKKDKVFRDILIHAVDDCNIQQNPFFGADPLIRVRNTNHLQEFMASDTREARAVIDMLDPRMREAFSSPACQLDNLTTLYVARRTVPGSPPTSFLKRVLPAYLLEKTLYRGTIVEANKRQRSFLHVTMGDDTWEPTPQEMAETVGQFQLADLDPLGAVLGTRQGVNATEIRQGGDFWKWSDNIDTFTAYKLRAMGISEAFLSADASYSNAETALSVFMENMDTFRSFMTYKVFTNKLFPIIAISNDFFKEGKEEDTSARREFQYQLGNHRDLVIPVLRWHKQLEARSDENMNEMLDQLRQKGIPIPLRMWLAAAKVDLNTLYQDLQQDEDIKKNLAKYSGQSPDDIANPNNTDPIDMPGEGGENRDSEFASSKIIPRHLMNKGRRRVPILARDFSNVDNTIDGRTKTGKRRFIPSAAQQAASDKIHGHIVKAMKELNNPKTNKEILKKVAARLGTIPNMMGEVMGFDEPTRRRGSRIL